MWGHLDRQGGGGGTGGAGAARGEGESQLETDRRLARAALGFSHAMVSQQFFAHVSPTGSTMDQRIRAAVHMAAGQKGA